jgi:hypothetical protein
MNINYLILILSQVLFSQTKLEQAVIKELNLYRKKFGLVALIYDAKSSEMSKYHADYLKKLNENDYLPLNLSYDQVHDELIDLPNFTEMTFEERASKVIPKVWQGEICIQCSNRLENEQQSAKSIINTFHNSPGHREVMQTPFNPKILDKVKPIISISIIESNNECPIVVNINIGYKLK